MIGCERCAGITMRCCGLCKNWENDGYLYTKAWKDERGRPHRHRLFLCSECQKALATFSKYIQTDKSASGLKFDSGFVRS